MVSLDYLMAQKSMPPRHTALMYLGGFCVLYNGIDYFVGINRFF